MGMGGSKASISRKINDFLQIPYANRFYVFKNLVVYYRKIDGNPNSIVYGISYLENSLNYFLQTGNSHYNNIYIL